eukprot:TRINITY_DN620_c0_g1_i2.p1 TRINITY_DN620_c0_g1~~TRINITY_DN620_c0_g1_i2.p1  ORF type:complete len:350 (-),score=20.39 TRINITY_DN620_c0_g1_i2:256-1305(-)
MRATIFISVLLVSYFALSTAETIFKETFPAGWEKRWVKAYPKKDENADGEWGWSAGKFYNDAEKDKGLQTTQDAKFYTISAQFPKEFSNKDKELIIQYTVKHEQNIDCGGGYVKLFPASLDQEKMNSESEYNIMFGPDICGPTKKTHVIFSHGGKNHLIKKEIRPESDEFTHIYRLVVKPDNTYKVIITSSSAPPLSLLHLRILKYTFSLRYSLTVVKKSQVLLMKIGIFFLLNKSKILILINLLTGSMKRRLMILKTKNLKDGTIFLQKYLILKPLNLTTGMKISTASGKLLKFLILNTKEFGNQKESLTLPTKANGSILLLIIQNTIQILHCMPMTLSSILVSMYGK